MKALVTRPHFWAGVTENPAVSNSIMNSMHPSVFLARAFQAPSAATWPILRIAVLLVSALAPLAALRAQSNYATPYIITTLAGTAGHNGYTDGTGSAASFWQPGRPAVDSAGNVYVPDSQAGIIRKITPAGVVTTFAGSASNGGSADGTGNAARFSAPMAVAVDSAGNLFVSDSGNHTIRKVTPAGVVTTFAGTAGSTGSTDGTGSVARFYSPGGIAVDSAGNVYVADMSYHTIRRITSAGVVTTFAGTAGSTGSNDGTGSAARFYSPSGVAVDTDGNVYVTDNSISNVRKITPAGVVTTIAGCVANGTYVGSTDGTGTGAQFSTPNGVAVDGTGNIYVADSGNNTIRLITPTVVSGVTSWVVTTLAGTAGSTGSADGTGSAARFYNPIGLAADSAGSLFIVDNGNDTVRKGVPASSKTTPVITWAAPSAVTYGTALSSTQLDATANVPGTFVYTPAAGTVLNAGSQTLSVTFTPTDTTNYTTATKTQPLVVNQGVPEITWFAPSAITAGTALSATQLNAEASLPGTFVYTPAAGTVPTAGSQILSVTFTPTDTTNYTTVTKTQTLAVISANYTVFLQQLFPLVLGRQIDPGGLSAYVTAMSNGETRSQVFGDLLGSSEYSALQIEPAIRLYSAALARSPDYTGLQNWSNALHAGVLTLTQAAEQFAGSTEFGLKYGSLDNTGYVQQLYRNVLGREADSSGLADWVGQLNAGASRGTILVGFS